VPQKSRIKIIPLEDFIASHIEDRVVINEMRRSIIRRYPNHFVAEGIYLLTEPLIANPTALGDINLYGSTGAMDARLEIMVFTQTERTEVIAALNRLLARCGKG
jgi:hypothetical protein